jgi:hypothetical protein
MPPKLNCQHERGAASGNVFATNAENGAVEPVNPGQPPRTRQAQTVERRVEQIVCTPDSFEPPSSKLEFKPGEGVHQLLLDEPCESQQVLLHWERFKRDPIKHYGIRARYNEDLRIPLSAPFSIDEEVAPLLERVKCVVVHVWAQRTVEVGRFKANLDG